LQSDENPHGRGGGGITIQKGRGCIVLFRGWLEAFAALFRGIGVKTHDKRCLKISFTPVKGFEQERD